MTITEALEEARQVFNLQLFEIAGTPVTPGTLVVFFVIVLAAWLISHVCQKALARALAGRFRAHEGTLAVFQRLLHYLILAIGLGVGLQTMGINLSALFAAGAVLAIGIGFGLQNVAQNFVSGVILLLERAIKPGDVLHVDGRFVKVTRMGIRATVARTLDEEEIIVPNATLVQAVVTNYTLQDSLYRLRTTVGVTYGSNMKLVRETLEATAKAIDWRTRSQEPVILLADFGDSAVVFEVSVWIDDPWRLRRRKSQLNEAIWWAFQDTGIVIAFPQLDVHFDAPITERLTELKAAV
jgi:small-conductance mechanosensitive channel